MQEKTIRIDIRKINSIKNLINIIDHLDADILKSNIFDINSQLAVENLIRGRLSGTKRFFEQMIRREGGE